MTCAAIYVRQSIDQDQGISQQLADCREEARRRGWRVRHEFKDNDTSGSKARGAGTGWADMLSAYDRGEFDVLIVVDVDRLTRRLADVLELRQKREIRIVTVRGAIDTQDDDFMLKQLVLLAEREVQVKTRRARRYAIERRKQGHPSPGHTPYGYRWLPASERDANGTRFEIVEDEAADVRRIFGDFLAGAPLGQIARDLNRAARTTRAGKPWRRTTVRRMLMNPHYAGLLPPAQQVAAGHYDLAKIDLDECEAGAWEPIVSRAYVSAARAQLVGREPVHNGTARRWLLSGLAVCATCREPVYAASGKSHPTKRVDGSGKAASKRYHTYRCRNYHFHRAGDPIDEAVTLICIRRLQEPDASTLLAQAADDGESPSELNAQLADLDRREQGIYDLLATRGNTGNAMHALETLDAERADLEARLQKVIQHDPLAEAVYSGDAEAWWDAASLGRRRTVVEELMTVVIRPVRKGQRTPTVEKVIPTIAIEWVQG